MRRGLVLICAVVAAIFVGFAGASAVINDDGHDTIGGPELSQPDGAGATLRVSTADPRGGQPWAIRVYRSVAGLTCPEAGRTQGGDFGQVDGRGEFHPNDIQAAGSCIDLDKAPMSLSINHYPANGSRSDRAVVFGVTSSEVRGVAIVLNGQRQELAIANGAFIAVVYEHDLIGGTIEATMRGGDTKTYHLVPSTLPSSQPSSDAP